MIISYLAVNHCQTMYADSLLYKKRLLLRVNKRGQPTILLQEKNQVSRDYLPFYMYFFKNNLVNHFFAQDNKMEIITLFQKKTFSFQTKSLTFIPLYVIPIILYCGLSTTSSRTC